MKLHELKTWPHYFFGLYARTKNFEVRRNDRDFQVNDLLLLEEYLPDKKRYTGNHILAKITYIMIDPEFVKEGLIEK